MSTGSITRTPGMKNAGAGDAQNAKIVDDLNSQVSIYMII